MKCCPDLYSESPYIGVHPLLFLILALTVLSDTITRRVDWMIFMTRLDMIGPAHVSVTPPMLTVQ